MRLNQTFVFIEISSLGIDDWIVTREKNLTSVIGDRELRILLAGDPALIQSSRLVDVRAQTISFRAENDGKRALMFTIHTFQ